MRDLFFYDLIRFCANKKNLKLRLQYLILGFIFYRFLARDFSTKAQGSDSASNSQAGDDIYPLF